MIWDTSNERPRRTAQQRDGSRLDGRMESRSRRALAAGRRMDPCLESIAVPRLLRRAARAPGDPGSNCRALSISFRDMTGAAVTLIGMGSTAWGGFRA